MSKLLAPTAEVSAYRLKAFCYIILMHFMPVTWILYDKLLNITKELCLWTRHCILCSSGSIERKLNAVYNTIKQTVRSSCRLKNHTTESWLKKLHNSGLPSNTHTHTHTHTHNCGGCSSGIQHIFFLIPLNIHIEVGTAQSVLWLVTGTNQIQFPVGKQFSPHSFVQTVSQAHPVFYVKHTRVSSHV